jgi:hypothetical protein
MTTPSMVLNSGGKNKKRKEKTHAWTKLGLSLAKSYFKRFNI